MNREKSKRSEPRRFTFDLTDKLDFNDPKNNMALANLGTYYTWKNMKSEYNNNKFNDTAPLILLIYMMVLILLQLLRIIFNLSSKNTNLRQKICQFKFTQIKSKTEFFQNKNRLQVRVIDFLNNEVVRK